MKYYIEYIKKNATKKHIFISAGVITLLGGLGTIGYLAKKGYLPSFNINLEEEENEENEEKKENKNEDEEEETSKLDSFIKNYRENEELMDQEAVINENANIEDKKEDKKYLLEINV
tara:strand:+ start:321 stop:671 length:351 start_codon:yes stop_codon:yes gene_type:complete